MKMRDGQEWDEFVKTLPISVWQFCDPLGGINELDQDEPVDVWLTDKAMQFAQSAAESSLDTESDENGFLSDVETAAEAVDAIRDCRNGTPIDELAQFYVGDITPDPMGPAPVNIGYAQRRIMEICARAHYEGRPIVQDGRFIEAGLRTWLEYIGLSEVSSAIARARAAHPGVPPIDESQPEIEDPAGIPDNWPTTTELDDLLAWTEHYLTDDWD